MLDLLRFHRREDFELGWPDFHPMPCQPPYAEGSLASMKGSEHQNADDDAIGATQNDDACQPRRSQTGPRLA